MPGGIDSHVHLAQNAFGGPKMADGFETGTRSAIAGGNTTVLALRAAAARRFAARLGDGLSQGGRRQVPIATTASTSSSPIPRPRVLGQELPALGRRRLLVVQGVHDLRRHGAQRSPVARSVRLRARLRRAGDGPLRGLRRDQVHDAAARGGGQDGALLPRRVAARGGRARGDPPRDQPRRAARHADHDRPRLRPRSDGADPLGAAPRPQGLWRDLPAIRRADRRRPQGPQHGRERRQIRLLAAAARPRLVGSDLGRHPHRRVPDLLVRPLPVLSTRGRRAS